MGPLDALALRPEDSPGLIRGHDMEGRCPLLEGHGDLWRCYLLLGDGKQAFVPRE